MSSGLRQAVRITDRKRGQISNMGSQREFSPASISNYHHISCVFRKYVLTNKVMFKHLE